MSANVNSQYEILKPLMDDVHSNFEEANAISTLQLAIKRNKKIMKELDNDKQNSSQVHPSPVHSKSAVPSLHLTEALFSKTRIALNSGIIIDTISKAY